MQSLFFAANSRTFAPALRVRREKGSLSIIIPLSAEAGVTVSPPSEIDHAYH